MAYVAVDGMGSEGWPRVEIEGVLAAVSEKPIDVILVGDRAVSDYLRGQVAEHPRIKVIEAGDRVLQLDDAARSYRQKPDSSIRTGLAAVADGHANAFVSAGHSGAIVTCAVLGLGRFQRIRRPALAADIPGGNGIVTLVDAGASIDVTPEMLAQYAVLGASYAKARRGKDKPRLGLLSNASEVKKGSKLTRQADAFLAEPQALFDYCGYVEGDDFFNDRVDVVVTDGFTGNIVLKVMEGMAKAQTSAFRRKHIKRKLEATAPLSPGGGVLLGVNGISIVCHHRSSPADITNAIIDAYELTQLNITEKVARGLRTHEYIWKGS